MDDLGHGRSEVGVVRRGISTCSGFGSLFRDPSCQGDRTEKVGVRREGEGRSEGKKGTTFTCLLSKLEIEGSDEKTYSNLE